MPYINLEDRGHTDLELIVVNWNGRELLRDCLASLLAAAPACRVLITVVDNLSTDGSVDMLRRDFSGSIRIVESPINGGFARGNNLALRECTARHALLLNSDATLPLASPHPLDVLVDFMNRHPEVGALGPRIVGMDGTVENSTGDDVSLRNILKNRFLHVAGLPHSLTGRVSNVLWSHDREREVDWASGAALVVRGEILRSGCLLDESYFMYTEDVEWCHRIRELGWKVMFSPAVTVLHVQHGSRPDRQWTRRRQRLHREGLLRFTMLHPSPWFLPLRCLLRLSLCLTV